MPTTTATTNKRQTKSRRSPLAWSIGVIIALLVFFILSLPLVVRHYAVDWLQGQGFPQVTIDDIDINLFNGEVALRGMRFGDATESYIENVSVELSYAALLQRQILFRNLRLDDIRLAIGEKEGRLSIAGKALPEQKDAPPSSQSQATKWGFGLSNVRFSNIQLVIKLKQLKTTISLERLELDSLLSRQPDLASKIRAAMRIENSAVYLEGSTKPLEEKPFIDASLSINKFPLKTFNRLMSNGLSGLQGRLSVDLKVRGSYDSSHPVLGVDGKLNLEDFVLNADRLQYHAGQASWQGHFAFVDSIEKKDTEIRTDGIVDISDLVVLNSGVNIRLLSAARLVANGISSNGGTVQLAHLNTDHLELFKKNQDSLLYVDSLGVNDIKINNNKTFAIDDITISGPSAKVALSAQHRIGVIDELWPETSKPVETKENDSLPWHYRIGRIHTTGPANLRYIDLGTKPHFNIKVSPFQLDVRNLDSAQPEETAVLHLDATLNELEKISFEAKARPFALHPYFEGKGKISDMELPPLSPYTNKVMGYFIQRGQLNADFTINVSGNQLAAEIQAQLNKIKLEGGDPAKSQSMTEKLSMPLDVALDLLRDKDDNIQLNLSVDGDVKDPKLDFSQVIRQSLVNATKKTALAYIQYTLQPWGGMLTLIKIANKVTKMRFDPLLFDSGGIALSDEHQQYLSKLATVLRERPRLELNICGLVSEQDRPALSAKSSNQDLIDLAEKRGQTVKRWLVDQGIEAGRLYTCQPVFDDAEKNPPQVELFL